MCGGEGGGGATDGARGRRGRPGRELGVAEFGRENSWGGVGSLEFFRPSDALSPPPAPLPLCPRVDPLAASLPPSRPTPTSSFIMCMTTCRRPAAPASPPRPGLTGWTDWLSAPPPPSPPRASLREIANRERGPSATAAAAAASAGVCLHTRTVRALARSCVTCVHTQGRGH